MSDIAWAGRLRDIGATGSEIAAIQAGYDDSAVGVESSLDTLIAGVDKVALTQMLSAWRTGTGPFGAGFPGGGLPFGSKVPVLTGSSVDDAFAIGAGTGVKIAASPAVGAPVTGATPNALLATDGSSDVVSGPLTASLLTTSAVNTFTAKNTFAASNANYVAVNGGGLADPGMPSQSTFYAVNGNILNPDANVRPVAASNFFYVTPGSAPLVNTDFHGWDLNTVAPAGSNVNSSSRIYALESAAQNKSNTTMGDLVAIYGNIAVGAGGSSGGSGGFCRSVQASMDLNGGATVTSWAAFYIRAPFKNDGTGGTVTTAYGLYIPNWTGNSATITTAYAIWVNQGGGQLLTQENVVINNVSGQANTASAALSINTDSTKLADALDIVNAGTGYGINVTQNGTSQPAMVITNASGNAHSCATLTQNGAAQALVINQNGAQTAATFTLASGASGFYGLVVAGYSHGLSVTTNASSAVNGAGLTVTYNKTAGSGIVAQLVGKGTGDYLDINNGTVSLFKILNSGQIKNVASGNEATGAGSAALGANCPAVTATAPYTWLKITTSDGSQGYVPIWK